MENIELKKHSSLVAICNRNISVVQRKLYNSLLYLTSKQLQVEPNNQKFKLKFSDVVKFSGYENFTNMKYLKESIRELVDSSVEFNITNKDKKNVWGVFSLLSQATIVEYDEYLTVEFPSMILEQIAVPSIYALLNLSVVNQLSGKYSLQLYELLTDFKKIKTFSISVLKLRKIFGIDESDFKLFNQFRSRVLDLAVNEINEKTDLEIEYVLEKIDSRSYNQITFDIKDKYEDMTPIEGSAYHLLKSKGLPDATSKRFAKQLSKKNILDAVESLEKAIKRGSVKNIQAYLTRILKNIKIDEEDCEPVHKPADPVALVHNAERIDSIEFKEYTKNRIVEIIQTLSFDAIEEFVQSQNDFGINYLIGLGLIDEHKEIINLKLLKENFLFLGFVESKFFDRDLEFRIFNGEDCE